MNDGFYRLLGLFCWVYAMFGCHYLGAKEGAMVFTILVGQLGLVLLFGPKKERYK